MTTAEPRSLQQLIVFPLHIQSSEALELEYDETNKMTCVSTKDSDQPGSSLSALWVAKDPKFLHAVCKDYDQRLV